MTEAPPYEGIVGEYFWDDLLDYVEEGTVVPVVGPGLANLRTGDGESSLDGYLAARLIERLELDSAG